MDSLARLRVLREVARTGSFSAAGRSLAMSQPSVSHHVALLEREMGEQLVERSVRGAALTTAGEIVLRHGLRMLGSADDARRDIAALRSGVPGTLHVAAFGTACSTLVPPALRRLRHRHPGLAFHLTEDDVGDAITAVRLGEADVAIAFDYAAHPLEASGLACHPLGDDPVAVVLPEHHPSAHREVVDIADLADEPWISGTGFGCAESLRTVCGASGFEPHVALHANRYPTTLALVAEGHGVALVPRTALHHAPADVVPRLLRPGAPPRRLWAITDPEPTDIVGELVDAVAETVRARTR